MLSHLQRYPFHLRPGEAADIEKERSAIETEFKVKAIYSPADMTRPAEIADMDALGEELLARKQELMASYEKGGLPTPELTTMDATPA